MEFEQIPTIKLQDDFDWDDFPQIYFDVLAVGLSMHFGAAKFILPDHMMNDFLPNDLPSIRAKLDRTELGEMKTKKMTICRDGAGIYHLDYVNKDRHPKELLKDKRSGTIPEFWQTVESSETTLTTYGSDVEGTIIGYIPIGSVLEKYVEDKKERRAIKKRLLKFLTKQKEELDKERKKESKKDEELRMKYEKKKFARQILPGIVSSFLYFGSWLSIFGLHQEDQDISALNLHLYGAIKVWYAIPAADVPKLKALCAELYPEEFLGCGTPLRHKLLFIDPRLLKRKGINVAMTCQRRGELVVSFPGAVHQGFNLGANINEAWNFAEEDSFPYIYNAQKCPCGKPIDLKGWKLCHSWLQEHDMDEENTWTEYDIPGSRMFYRPYHLPATVAEVRPHMNAEHRNKRGLLSTADYADRLAEYRNLASNRNLTTYKLYGIDFLFNALEVEEELACELTRFEMVKDMSFHEKKSWKEPKIPEGSGLPDGLLFQGYAFRFMGIPSGSNRAYYVCLGTNCKWRCTASVGLLFTSAQNPKKEKGKKFYRVKMTKPHNIEMMELDDEPCSSRTRQQ